MPNLLTTLMPEMTALSPPQGAGAAVPGIGKSTIHSDGYPVEGAASSFPAALSEQLGAVMAWLNPSADGGATGGLLLPPGGKGLPLEGDALQTALAESDLSEMPEETALVATGLPLLPPGMAPLETEYGAMEAQLSLLPGRTPGGTPPPAAARTPLAAGIGAVLAGGAAADEAAAEALPLAESSAADADQALFGLVRETSVGERAALLQGMLPSALRGAAQRLQGSEAVVAAALPGGVALPAPASTPAPVPLPQFSIDVAPGQPGWGEALGERVSWMINQQQPGVQLRINPPHLGPLEIKVSVQHDQASVSFTAHHAATAEHLEAAMPRLREMLADQGLQLAQFDVRHQGGGAEARSGQGEGAARDDLGLEGGESDGSEPAALGVRRGDGLLDTYA